MGQERIERVYDSAIEHDACGIGAVVDLNGRPCHDTVDKALKIVEKLEHRAGKDASGETGDGVGLMIQVPHRLMVKAAAELGIALGEARDYGVGMFFFPQDTLKRAQAKEDDGDNNRQGGHGLSGLADVPTHPEVLGRKALDCMPRICQCFVARPEGLRKRAGFRPEALCSPEAFRAVQCEHLHILLFQPHHCIQGNVSGGTAEEILLRPQGCRL